MNKYVIILLILSSFIFCFSCKKHMHNYIDGICECGDKISNIEDNEEYTKELIFQLSNDGKYYIVVGINGSGLSNGVFVPPEDNESIVEVIIPKYYKGLPVTTIQTGAFDMCFNLKKIMISDNITTIYPGAFGNINSLEYNVYDNLKYLGNSDNPYHILMGVIDNNLETYNIHGETKVISTDAFKNCFNVDTIYIPNNIEYISSRAFIKCPKLTILCESKSEKDNWQKEIIGIKSWNPDNLPVYYNVNKNSLVDYNNNLFLLSNETATLIKFKEEIEDVILDNSIKYNDKNYIIDHIGDSAFYHCDNIKSIKLPDSIKKIGKNAFTLCVRLSTIYIPNSVNEIGDFAFDGCGKLKSIELPNNLQIIESNCFRGCGSLESITMPDGITEIKDCAFSSCKSLTKINLPSKLLKLGKSVFIRCNNLSELFIPKNVQYIDPYSFAGSYISTIECDIQNNIYYTKDNVLYKKEDENVILYAYLPSIKSEIFSIPSDVNIIGKSAFEGNNYLKEIIISSNVEIIEENAFYSCGHLEKVIIPNSVSYIGRDAFRNCDNLIIYCEASKQPENWDINWNSSYFDIPVEWDYKE